MKIKLPNNCNECLIKSVTEDCILPLKLRGTNSQIIKKYLTTRHECCPLKK